MMNRETFYGISVCLPIAATPLLLAILFFIGVGTDIKASIAASLFLSICAIPPYLLVMPYFVHLLKKDASAFKRRTWFFPLIYGFSLFIVMRLFADEGAMAA